MKQLFFLIFSLHITSCGLVNKDPEAERKRSFDRELSILRDKFMETGVTGTGEISDFFSDKGFEQIPSSEKSFHMKTNNETKAVERLAFVKIKDDIVGFVDIQLREPVLMRNFTFYKELGYKANIENQANYDFFLFDNYTIGVNSFCYKGLWYSEGGSVYGQ